MKILLFVLLSLSILTSCYNNPEDKNISKPYNDIYQLSDHVYYLACDNSDVGIYYEQLLEDIDTSKNRVVAISGDGSGSSGRDQGWFIFIERK